MLIVVLLFCNASIAQDKITFVWEGGHELIIRATEGETFTIDWGDDTPIEIKTGLDTANIHLLHVYDGDCEREYTVTIAASNTDCKFTYFYYCPLVDDILYSQISSLKLEGCSDLMFLFCWYNSIPLSDLYAAHLVMNEQSVKIFGSQFVARILKNGMTLDFSSQQIIGGVETVFSVCKNTQKAIIDVDYSIVNGIITFIKEGYYEVWLNNAAIPFASYYVGTPIPGNIPENCLPNFKIYPNPTNDIAYIKTDTGIIPELKLYSLDGRLLQQIRNTEIDLSGYSAGIYLLSINGKTMKVIKK